jgi:nitrogen fixation NifU-like protein
MNFDDLYQDIILDHYKHPRGYDDLRDVSDEEIHENPLCGDSIKLRVEWEDGKVKSVRHNSKGCALSTASASLMTQALAGMSRDEAIDAAETFIAELRDGGGPDGAETLESLTELDALRGVSKFPMRVKCVTLAWHAALDALSAVKP